LCFVFAGLGLDAQAAWKSEPICSAGGKGL